MTQTTLWLLPLVLGSIFGIVSALKAGLRWSWGVVVQHGFVLLISLLGLFVIPKWDWLCAGIGWIVLLTFTVIARILLVKMTQSLGLLRCEKAVGTARLLRFILWGPPGKYWLDLAYMINFYLRSDTRAANQIYQKWQDFKLPKSVADSLAAYAMIGLLVMRDWNSTIEKYEQVKESYLKDLSSKKKDARFPVQIAVPAIRAFNETGRFKDAEDAMRLADLPSSNYGRESLETIFLSYFSLLGATSELNEVLESMKGSKNALPEHARIYWQARCSAEKGDYESAIRLFAESLRKTPDKDSAWKERTQYQLNLNQQRITEEKEPLDPEKLSQQESAAKLGLSVMRRCFIVSDILNSRKAPRTVRILTGLVSIVFILTFAPYLFGDRSYALISKNFFYWGVLDARVFQGEWWRLLSYQFLHGGFSHLFMNVFGLVWFGRYVENIFGARRFLIIYFGSGVLSGLAQIILDPTGAAVGASGAILGIFGAGLAATLRLKNILPANIRKSELSWMLGLAVTQLLFDQLVNLFFPVRAEVHDAVRIAAAAHFGGMVSGFALGWILPLKKMGTEDIS
ncbi:MAG: rhomboid family intramembrane serine protease [Candidatus Obscuribacterales bacterium]|nr:rhomboid family intramembrane serine protease [Candidatus Obscuribacterales bacterium]